MLVPELVRMQACELTPVCACMRVRCLDRGLTLANSVCGSIVRRSSVTNASIGTCEPYVRASQTNPKYIEVLENEGMHASYHAHPPCATTAVLRSRSIEDAARK